ncbi:hypothetical protein PUNSTDRAFT_80994 [Punctularia strigosozonata HHB-11173 SS5]|uniref:uncharacterized protein n=1 Tax=Punctularia strigosozonata (strain HHB-11173) TaxID=741275 RepID=UPI0004417BD4|nr:uncharacterized protein PUNSTDRAFT_80994 [Punctularia strigosozonata HHB-11173 SS5]EIN14542.1 hypothetical protein PUNSTDRAFT_80994 [Punctularia strigosozonata HHB-11173 SS5]
MVSANNLNLDVVEHICAHIATNDLLSVALVSRAFFAGVIPRLYRTLAMRRSQGKKYPSTQVQTAFSAILTHPEYAVHVRTVDIRIIPEYRNSIRAEFMRNAVEALRLSINLASLVCTTKEVTAFLLAVPRPDRLQELRIQANLTPAQGEVLLRMSNLKQLTLEFPSWNVVDILPRWAAACNGSLTSLTLYVTSDLDEDILETILGHLPRLTGLHVINCPKVDHIAVFRMASLTPLLSSLAFTTWESPRSMSVSSATVTSLPRLTHLALDTHCSLTPSTTPTLWAEIFSKVKEWGCSLRSVQLKMSHQLQVGEPFLHEFLTAHGATLKQLAFINCGVTAESLRSICIHANTLEKLSIAVPVKDMAPFKMALSSSKTLHTLVDLDDSHHRHGQRPSLTTYEVRTLMTAVPKLRTFVSDSRRWVGEDSRSGYIDVRLERRQTSGFTAYWFMPTPH